MRVLIAVDLNDDDLTAAYGHDLRTTNLGDEWDDIVTALDARASEFYGGPHNDPIRGRLVAACDVTDVLPEFINATEVGADGIEDEHKRDHVLGSLVTLREG